MASLLNPSATTNTFLQQSFNKVAEKGGIPPSQLEQAIKQQMYGQSIPNQPKSQMPMTLMNFIKMLGGQ